MKLNIFSKVTFLAIFTIFIALINNFSVLAAFPGFEPEEGIFVIENNSGDVILSQHENERYYPASTTKLMTALVLADTVEDIDESVIVGEEVYDYGDLDSRAKLVQGQTISYRDLIHALLIPSGNDAAATIAINVGRKMLGDPNVDRMTAYQTFVNAMNQKAIDLGLTNTHFVNPHGVFNEDHYTTPAEMAVIAREAFKYDVIKSAASTPVYNLVNPDGTINTIRNTNILIFDDLNQFSTTPITTGNPLDPIPVIANPYKTDLLTAAKTGTTDQGGRTFVFLSEMNGNSIIGILFKTGDMAIFDQSKAILEELSLNYRRNQYTDENGYFNTYSLENVHYTSSNNLSLYTPQSISSYTDNPTADELSPTVRWDDNYVIEDETGQLQLVDTIKPGTKVGALIIANANYTKTIPLYSDNYLIPKNWEDQIVDHPVLFSLILISLTALIVTVIAIVIFNRKKYAYHSSKYTKTKF